jgi:glycylpeptide N-tetradecanoyltransferase
VEDSDEKETATITDFISFYSLPSSCLKNPNYSHVNVAYTYYNVPNKHDLNSLFVDALVLARDKGYDVMNCLDIMNYGSQFE